MSAAGRTRAHRRDRRKAKASDWTRAPKPQMGRVGHGASGPTTRDASSSPPMPTVGPTPRDVGRDVRRGPLRVSIGERVRARRKA